MKNLKTWEDVSEAVKTILMGPVNCIHPEIMNLMHMWAKELEMRQNLPADINGTDFAPNEPMVHSNREPQG
jgi:hypothetical protein